MNPTFSTQGEARRALGRIVRNASDLLEQDESGAWTFDISAAEYLADMNPEDDMRPIQQDLTERVAHLKSAQPTHEGEMNTDNEQYETVEQSEVFEESSELVDSGTTAEGSEGTAAEGEGEDVKLSPLERARQRAERAAERLRRAEEAEAGRAEREAKAAERKAARDERKAKQEAAKAEREAKKAAKRESSEARKAEREANKAAKQEIRDRLAAERQAEREAARAAREATKVKGIAKPAQGTKLGNLWELIDTLTAVNGAFPSFKEYSAANLEMSYADAGGESTRTTAYYDYRMYHGITGRIGNTVESEGASDEQEG